MKVFVLALVLFLALHATCKAQPAWKIQTGLGYLEHFSAGMTLSLQAKHHVSLLYGSNFFVKPGDFSSLSLQYERSLNRWQLAGLTPKWGIKGGWGIYTNDYYRWNLLMLAPFVGVTRPLSKRIDLFMDLGIVRSHPLSLERIQVGAFGSYKHYLPECKIGLHYRL